RGGRLLRGNAEHRLAAEALRVPEAELRGDWRDAHAVETIPRLFVKRRGPLGETGEDERVCLRDERLGEVPLRHTALFVGAVTLLIGHSALLDRLPALLIRLLRVLL